MVRQHPEKACGRDKWGLVKANGARRTRLVQREVSCGGESIRIEKGWRLMRTTWLPTNLCGGSGQSTRILFFDRNSSSRPSQWLNELTHINPPADEHIDTWKPENPGDQQLSQKKQDDQKYWQPTQMPILCNIHPIQSKLNQSKSTKSNCVNCRKIH